MKVSEKERLLATRVIRLSASEDCYDCQRNRDDRSTSWSATYVPAPDLFNTYDVVNICYKCDKARQQDYQDDGGMFTFGRWDEDPLLQDDLPDNSPGVRG